MSFQPTVYPASNFSPVEDAETLRGAMKGLGTDEDTIINILTTRSNSQRVEIAKQFSREYGRDIIEDLKSELGGNFEDAIIALMTPTAEYLAREINNSMEGMGTEEHALVEILCTRSKNEMAQIVEAYETLFGRPLAEHLCSETGGHFRRLLTLIVTCVRDEESNVDPGSAKEDAQKLYDAGEAQWGTDEEVFNRIFAHSSFAQLRLVFEEYKALTGRTVEQAIKSEMDGDLKEALSAIVECVESPAAFFAARLRDAMQGAGTDDRTLIRIIVSRSEIDLGTIKSEYERLYDKTLESDVAGETSGDFRRVLLALIGPAV